MDLSTCCYCRIAGSMRESTYAAIVLDNSKQGKGSRLMWCWREALLVACRSQLVQCSSQTPQKEVVSSGDGDLEKAPKEGVDAAKEIVVADLAMAEAEGAGKKGMAEKW